MVLPAREEEPDPRQAVMRRGPLDHGGDDADGQEEIGPEVGRRDGEPCEDAVERHPVLGKHGRQLRQRTDALHGRGRGNSHDGITSRHLQSSQIRNCSAPPAHPAV